MENEKIVELAEKHDINTLEDLKTYIYENLDVLFGFKIKAKDEDGNTNTLPIRDCILDEIYEMSDFYEMLKGVLDFYFND